MAVVAGVGGFQVDGKYAKYASAACFPGYSFRVVEIQQGLDFMVHTVDASEIPTNNHRLDGAKTL